MDLNTLPNLADYMTSRLAATSLDAEERAHIENFMLDERPPEAGVKLYAKRLKDKPIDDFNNWHHRHKNYVAEELNLNVYESDVPWTFRADNAINRLRQIDPRIYLVRVESVSWVCDMMNITPENLRQQIEKYQTGDTKASDFLKRVLTNWNDERDQRPMFATTELEVNDILDEADWAERLRDQLGLGHYSDRSGRPIEVVLMRYTVQEVLDSLSGEGYPAIPTVLDSDMSPYFFPSPLPPPDAVDKPYLGHTVNLTPVDDDNDYTMGVELLHPRIEYKPEHFYKMGVIKRPVEMPLERARRFHLPWLRVHRERDDFGDSL